MAVASLVLGIISVILGIIPFCNVVAYVPAIVGLILGICALVKANKPVEVAEGEEAPKSKKGISIAGIICNGVALVIITVMVIIAAFAVKTVADVTSDALKEQFGVSLDELSDMSEEEMQAKLAEISGMDEEELEKAIEDAFTQAFEDAE